MSSRTALVHRALAVRVGVAAVALSTLVGALGFVLARRDLDRAIAERARLGTELLRLGIDRRLAAGGASLEAAFADEVERLAATLPPSETGRFALLVLVDADGRELARVATAGGVEVRREPPAHPGTVPDDVAVGAWRRDGDAALVAVSGPLSTAGGRAELRGWFRLSGDAVAALRARARRSTLLSAAAVLLTALVVYPIVRRLVEGQGRLAADLLDANLETLATLGSAIAKRDADTDAHNFRVVVYSARLAEAVGQPPDLVRRLIKGAFVHDVGKIGVRDAVLLKPGGLDAVELEEMRRHVEHGLEIVGRCAWLGDAAGVVGGHHERVDGGGYPRRLAGAAIPLEARIFALADVFDAVTSDRPYHRARPLAEALELLERGRESHFDGSLLDAFLEIAPGLHAGFANRSEEPRREAAALVDRHFRADPSALASGASARRESRRA